MFCILAAHEHYTLDVLMGFYVSTRTFQSYHAVAAQIDSSVDPRSAGSTSGAARKQRRRWFPMVSFLEENATEALLVSDGVFS
ncbi:hypothetical protein T484DRAFT_1793162 [Baffinella frigidus]|nr:hypothetical protein T484DRAFT_1793162 [Cryptophyta sp. CCMP2293]